MVEQSPAEIEQMLDAGTWLRPGQVATLLGVERTTVHRRMGDGTLGWRRRGGGKLRECDPADVRRLLDDARKVHRGPAAGEASET